jgi:hypothetical protein
LHFSISGTNIKYFVCTYKYFSKNFQKSENWLFWGLLWVGSCGGANAKCANVGRLKLFFKMCGGKIFKTLRWLVCRQSQVGLCQEPAKLSAVFWSSVGGRVGRPSLAGNVCVYAVRGIGFNTGLKRFQQNVHFVTTLLCC